MIFRALLLVVVGAAFYFLWRLAEVKLKAGASLEGVSWRMFYAAIVADGIYKRHGAECVITEGADTIGRNHAKTLHDDGLALDLRTWNVLYPHTVAADLRKALGDSYDVVLEKDHIHVEYHPKTV